MIPHMNNLAQLFNLGTQQFHYPSGLPNKKRLKKWMQLGLMLSFGLAISGCQETLMRTQSPDKPKSEKNSDKFVLDGPVFKEPDLVGNFTTFSGLNMVLLEGVGLINGLNSTGEDPPVSNYRAELLDDLRRRGVPEPNEVIKSPATALVVVRAYLPPLVQVDDKFDIEVRVPERSGTSNLNGGWLLECNLNEQAVVSGKGILTGNKMAVAQGPVLVSLYDGQETRSAKLTRGRVVGGATSNTSRTMQILLQNDFRSYRNAKRLEEKIGTRFYSYNKYGNRESLASAKTDQKIELKIHPRYKDNFPRYMRVIQNIAFREDEVERRIRMERLEKELFIADKSEVASLQLEAIGEDAMPTLKRGLKAPLLECRFYSACSLAYMGNSDGLEALFEAARDEPAFRVFAFAAMSATNDGQAFVYLRQLMDEESLETRYGAFRTMTVIDEHDPYVEGEMVNEQFKLHMVDSKKRPMIHLTQQKKAEVVIYGLDQRFKTPLMVRAGQNILVTALEGGEQVKISKHTVREDEQKIVPNRVYDVIKAIGELDGSYPDVAQMLVQANHQSNLEGNIGIDQLPMAGRYYERPSMDGIQLVSGKSSMPSKSKIGTKFLAPNLFMLESGDKDALKPEISSGLNADKMEKDQAAKAKKGEASLVDDTAKNKSKTVSKEKEAKEEEPKKRTPTFNERINSVRKKLSGEENNLIYRDLNSDN